MPGNFFHLLILVIVAFAATVRAQYPACCETQWGTCCPGGCPYCPGGSDGLSAAASVSNEPDEFEASAIGFAAWAAKYGRSPTPTEAQLKIFLENHQFVKVHNANKDNTWKASLNKFSDMTAKEFKEKVLMKKALSISKPSPNHGHSKKRFPKATAAAFDWRSVGGVLPVQDQGYAGTCWSFSTVGAIEGAYFKATNATMKFSEEFFVDCDGTSDYNANHADCSVYGGWPYLAYQFAMSAGGVPTEQAMPYCAGDGSCYPCMQGPEKLCGPPPYSCDRSRDAMCKSFVPAVKLSGWRDVSTDESEMADDLVATGSLSVLLDAQYLQHYKSGVWDGSINGAGGALKCNSVSLDHAVLVTGYGVDGGSGSGSNNLEYWSVKNSWGADWGEEGYFRIIRGNGQCGINTAVTTPIV